MGARKPKWLGNDAIRAVSVVLRGGQLSGFWNSFDGGRSLQAFEREFAKYVGTSHAVAVSSGTASIHVGLLAGGAKPNTQVAVSPYTHVGSVSPILMCGSKPLFVDIEAESFNMDPADLDKAIGKSKGQVSAILAAHQIGDPCDMKAIQEVADKYSLPIIEDSSQALGAESSGKKVGSIGRLGCFSLGGDMTKTISTGEGGMVTVPDDELAFKCKCLRNSGERYQEVDYLCANYRMPEVLAVIGLAQMKKVEFMVAWQRRNAEYLSKHLPDYLTVRGESKRSRSARTFVGCSFHPERASMGRDDVLKKLRAGKLKIGSPRRNISGGYGKLVYQVPFYEEYKRRCANAEAAIDSTIWIDWHRYPMTRNQVDTLTDELRRFGK